MHRQILCLLLATIHAATAVPAEPAHDHEHDAQPPGTQAAPAAPSQGEAMRNMRAMHEKMMAAKTPAERGALMAEHMKAMQEGMMSMRQMDSMACADGAGSQMRMNMMDMMMQMMRDQQAGSAPPRPPVAPQR